EVIIESRDVGGGFDSLTDFCQRVDQQKVNKKVFESLIKAGAMDRFGKRAAMLSGLENIRAKGVAEQKRRASGQMGIFDEDDSSKGNLKTEDELPQMEEFSQKELLSLEKDLLGFYLTEHPLNPVLPALIKARSHKLFEISQGELPEQNIKIGGIVTKVRSIVTRKSGKEMAFVTLEDDSGSQEMVVFPKIFVQFRDLWDKDKLVFVKGRLEKRDEGASVIVETASPLEEAPVPKKEELKKEFDFEIRIPSRISSRKLMELNKLLKQNQGKDRLSLAFIDDSERIKRMVLPYGINYTQDLKETIELLLKR
ncbi:OB-fold nucleic acid binding domain-containing protein, partial [Patescibacteria group bacterium]